MDKKVVYLPIIIVAGIALVALIGLLYYQTGVRIANNVAQITPPPTIPQRSTPVPTLKYIPPSPKPTFYQSNRLGVSFTYDANMYNQNVSVRESGDKIYIFVRNPDQTTTAEKYVEVIAKNPSDSIEQAVKKLILKGYSLDDCLVKKPLEDIYADAPDYTKTYVSAQIQTPLFANATTGDWVQAAKKCPQTYTRVNSLKYFMMDTLHPSKLLFFNVGQDSFVSDVGTWEQSVRLTD